MRLHDGRRLYPAPCGTFDLPARHSNGALKCKTLTGGSKVGCYHVKSFLHSLESVVIGKTDPALVDQK